MQFLLMKAFVAPSLSCRVIMLQTPQTPSNWKISSRKAHALSLVAVPWRFPPSRRRYVVTTMIHTLPLHLLSSAPHLLALSPQLPPHHTTTQAMSHPRQHWPISTSACAQPTSAQTRVVGTGSLTATGKDSTGTD